MPKSRKKKNEDFKKVKLKVGKKLKKPTETNTAFKAGKVVLLEQLNRDAISKENIPSTKRKLALTDLLHHLKHYNVNVRKDGINGLKELLTENAHLIKDNMFQIVERLGPLLQDTETDILKTATSVWELILTAVDTSNLSPYWQLISAHLNCAMTHLNVDVKRYSLKILNLLLASHSSLFRRSSSSSSSGNDLVGCFLDLLPHSAAGSSTGGAKSKASQSLMSTSSKHDLLKSLKNILSTVLLVNADEAAAEDQQNQDHHPAITTTIDCGESNSAIISVSLSAAEWSHRRVNSYDDQQLFDEYVRPQRHQTSTGIVDQYTQFIERVFPFCHSFWIEVTSVETATVGRGNNTSDVDHCYTFDLATLLIMNDILSVYNSLLGQLLLHTAANHDYDHDNDSGSKSASETTKYTTVLKNLMPASFVDRYYKTLPCRRASRKAGEAAATATDCGGGLKVDACSSVNFGLCRFLAYVSALMAPAPAPKSRGRSVYPSSYPVEKISDVLADAFAREKMDAETLRCCAELVRDLRFVVGPMMARRQIPDETSTEALEAHYSQLKLFLMNCVLSQQHRNNNKNRWKVKADIITWICRDIEQCAADLPNEWPLFEQFVERLPKLMSSMVEASAGKDDEGMVLDLLYRLTRVMLLRLDQIPQFVADKQTAIRIVIDGLLKLLCSQIHRYSSSRRREAMNLLYYAIPLGEKIAESLREVIVKVPPTK